jgi:hypothetical protein
MRARTTSGTALVVGICLVGAACGGGSSDATPATDAPPAATEAPAEEPAEEPTQATDAPDEPTPEPEATDAPQPTDPPPATDPPPPVTTEPPAPEPVSFDLATLPDLIDIADQATTDPTITPLSIAQQLIGFPYEIPVPDGSTLYEVEAGLWTTDGTTSTFEFSYDAIAPGGEVPDIDITLDGNGPGSAQVTEIWDPIMAGLGFERENSTGSDPGDPGGPNSVNHVYVAANPTGSFNGVPGEVAPVFVWSTEDINGWSYSPEREPLSGYSIDVGADTVTEAGVPIPLVATLLEQIPVPDGLTLSDADVNFYSRSPDSFDAEKGLHYVDVYIEWEAPADQLDAVIAFYSDPAALFSDEATVMAGEASFFDEGMIERSELTDYDVADKRLELLLLQRYEGTLGIDASDGDGEPMSVSVDFEINVIAPPLELPAE